MGRLLYIGIISFLGISFILCTCLLNYGLKKVGANGKMLIDEPVNENIKTGKIKIGEILVYVLMFIIAIFFVIQILYKGGRFPSATAILIRTVILVPIMALFNARKRTGKALVALFSSLLFLVFCTMTYMIVGLPVKAPVLTINDTEIKLGQTTVEELMDDGFEVYMEIGNATMMDHLEFPHSQEFEKYSDSMDISVPKGYHWQSTEIAPYSKGVLAINSMPVADVIFHGSMTNEKSLKECSIIHLYIRKIYIPKIREIGMSVKLNGVDLLSKIEAEKMKKTFGRKIVRPNEVDIFKSYIIGWDTNSQHLFFNTYGVNIEMDDDYLAEEIELECQIAREADS